MNYELFTVSTMELGLISILGSTTAIAVMPT